MTVFTSRWLVARVAIQLYGTLQELQLVVVEITNGLVEIAQVRGLEGR